MKVSGSVPRNTIVRILVPLGVLMITLMAATSPAAQAATFTVKNTKDAGTGSLRQAILNANGRMGPDTIRFRIDGRGVKTIRPKSPLPQITTDALTIDGYTQRGARSNTLSNGTNAKLKIQLDGTNAQGGFAALVVGPGADGSRISGLVINRFENSGISIEVGGCSVAGNFIGTNASGSADLGNGDIGVNVGGNAGSNMIGGEFLNARNLISGNEGHGVRIDGNLAANNAVWSNLIGTNAAGNAALGNAGTGVALTDGASDNSIGGRFEGARNVISGNGGDGVSMVASDNAVQGNFIGTDEAGNADLGNTGSGVLISSAADNTIGGTASGSRNVISGNDGNGVSVFGSGATGNDILGNRIGVRASSNAALGNSMHGVFLQDGPSANAVGGTTSGAGNLISANGQDGVSVQEGATGNSILGNSILANGTLPTHLGIDLGNNGTATDGVTANDAGDADSGPNNLQNFPLIGPANRSSTGLTTINGSLSSVPNEEFVVECFATIPGEPSGHGEGQIPAGRDETVTTNASGNASFTCVSTGPAPGHVITATATRESTGDTSEFAQNVALASVP